VVFSKTYTRLLIWSLTIVILAYLLTRDPGRAWSWPGTLAAGLLSGAGFTVAAAFMDVTRYPFSLGWSEGNRLWDFSIMFGRRLYDYPANKPLEPYLDLGRQFIGGLPYLLPHVSIWMARFWIGLTNTIPYLLLGWLLFARVQKGTRFWLLTGLWAFMFLNQGPIHTPLVFCAMLVVAAWDRSLWLAVPLVMISSYLAETSRFTWLFAPGIWAAVFELSGAVLNNGKLNRQTWVRSISVGVAGVFGGFIVPLLINFFNPVQNTTAGVISNSNPNAVTTTTITGAVMHQPLLWYRLLPNATYGYGIFLGLIIAVGPLVILLSYLVLTHRWPLNLWQKLGILLPSLAFLAVGLVASTKIGGGGDLHNTDMFLIGLLFASAIYIKNGDHSWLVHIDQAPGWVMLVVFLAVLIPGYPALMTMQPISFAGALPKIITLTDSNPLARSLGSLPADDKVQVALTKIRTTVAAEKTKGEILFMDQRQLLTFGAITDVPLVPDYDKKLLIDQAMSGNEVYFQRFYADLAAHRFALIVSGTLRTPIKDSEYGFGEENNAWVNWVARPVLCYYEEKDTLLDVHTEMLVPKQGITDCSGDLPWNRP
jgi:hypothetical protein